MTAYFTDQMGEEFRRAIAEAMDEKVEPEESGPKSHEKKTTNRKGKRQALSSQTREKQKKVKASSKNRA